jgi:acyl carrier protein
MTEVQITETIYKLLGQIAPEANVTQLAPNVDIRQTLDIDSFDHLNLLIGLNDALGIDIPRPITANSRRSPTSCST